ILARGPHTPGPPRIRGGRVRNPWGGTPTQHQPSPGGWSAVGNLAPASLARARLRLLRGRRPALVERRQLRGQPVVLPPGVGAAGGVGEGRRVGEALAGGAE